MKRDEHPIDRVEDHAVKDYRSGMPATPPTQPDEQHAGHENRTLWGDAWQRLRKNRLAVI